MDDTMAHLSNTGEPCAMKVARTVRRRTVGKVPPQGGNSLAVYPTERTRRALRIVDAMQPAILYVDEVEKALSGVAGSSSSDSGVSARMFASLLSWLNDHDSDVFVVCTANDVSKLPPEFNRAERFDALFFLDLPESQQKLSIWQMYRQRFDLASDQPLPDDQNWTGAEIRACCRLAALLDVPLVQAAQNIVPVAATAAESVSRLRDWASGRCLSAETTGLYTNDSTRPKPRRKIGRNPSNN